MKLNIYYLDDEKTLCEIFEEFFSTDTIHVKTFTDADVAIKACSELPPDILFIDMRLTGTTGDKVAQRVSENITKILVTGDLTYNSEYQFSDVISKPLDVEQIEKILNTL